MALQMCKHSLMALEQTRKISAFVVNSITVTANITVFLSESFVLKIFLKDFKTHWCHTGWLGV